MQSPEGLKFSTKLWFRDTIRKNVLLCFLSQSLDGGVAFINIHHSRCHVYKEVVGAVWKETTVVELHLNDGMLGLSGVP